MGMRSSALALFVALYGFAVHAQCTPVTGVPVAPVRFTPTCGHSVATIAANPNGALALWSNVHAGFSMITYWMSGTTLDAQGRPRRFAEHIYEQGPKAAIATDGHDFLVVTNINKSVLARAVTADGVSGESNVIATNVSKDPLVAWTGSAYVIAAASALVSADHSGRVLSTKTIDGEAVAISERFVIVRTASGFASIAFDGDEVTPLPIPATATEVSVAGDLVVWRDGATIAAVRQGSAPFTIANTAGTGSGVVREADGELVLWTSDWHVDGVRVASSVGPVFRVADGTFASAASTGVGTIVLTRAGCGSIASTFVSRDAQPSSSADVSLAAIAQTQPQIVTTPSGHQVFWRESSAIMTAFVANDGTIGAESRVNSPASDIVRYVSARAGEETYLFWSDYPDGQLPGTLRAARFDSEGHFLGEFQITAAWFIFGLTAASDGSAITVAWTEQPQLSARFVVKAARIEAAAVTVQPALLSVPDEVMYEVISATDGASSLISWRDGQSTLVSVRLDSQLRPLLRRDIAAPTGGVVFPLAAGLQGSESLLAWWSVETDGVIRLHATLSESADAVVRSAQTAIIAARAQRSGDGWLVDSQVYDSTTGNVTLQRSDVEKDTTEVLACAPGEFDYTTAGDRVDFMVSSAPQPENEGAAGVFVHRQSPPRRRASR